MWNLIPVKVDNSRGTFTPSQASDDEDTIGRSSTRTEHTESESDELGTVVNEVVTVTTTTVTTRRRYRVGDV